MLKFLKKLIVCVLIGAISFSLFACDYVYHLYHENVRNGCEVVLIEVIIYDNQKAQDNPLEEYPFDLEKLNILETLDNDDIDSFLAKLSKIGGLAGKFKNVLYSPCGTGIRLSYNDNGFTLITIAVINSVDSIFVGHYDAEMKLEHWFGISWQEMIDDFKELIGEYFTTQI